MHAMLNASTQLIARPRTFSAVCKHMKVDMYACKCLQTRIIAHKCAPAAHDHVRICVKHEQVTDKESFEHVETWMREIKKFTSDSEVRIVVVGNKVDLASSRQVHLLHACCLQNSGHG